MDLEQLPFDHAFPPFEKNLGLESSELIYGLQNATWQSQNHHVRGEMSTLLRSDLEPNKLNKIHHHLWLAGLTRPCRPLHRQKLLGRKILVTEDPNEHLIWHESFIFVKPLPQYLLDFDFWADNLCPNGDLCKSATGFPLSYIWLMGRQSDFLVGKEENLLPESLDWKRWAEFADSVLHHVNVETLHQVNTRYRFGELRLARLDALYRRVPSVFSFRHFVSGFMSRPTWYKAFFGRNFAWMLAVFAYVTVILSAMQVGLAVDGLAGNERFQSVSYGFAVFAIIATIGAVFIMLIVWMLPFCYHISSTWKYTRGVELERERKHREVAGRARAEASRADKAMGMSPV